MSPGWVRCSLRRNRIGFNFIDELANVVPPALSGSR